MPHAQGITLFVVAGLASAAVAQPSFQGLGFLPGTTWSWSSDVSSDGLVVSGFASGPMGDRSFRWTEAGGIVDIGDLPGGPWTSFSEGISGDGLTLVGSSIWTPGREAYYWTEATGMVSIGDLPGGAHRGYSVDASFDGSVIVGQGNYDLDQNGYTAGEAFRWTQATGMVGLGDLPGGIAYSWARSCDSSGDVIVGPSESANGIEAFRWTASTGMVGLGELPGGGFYSDAFAVSNDGSVVAGVSESAQGYEIFRWTEQTGMVALGGLLHGDNPINGGGFDMNADGTVIVGVGAYTACNGRQEAMIWTEADGARRLRDVLLGLGVTEVEGWWLTGATAVSADGRTIAGFGVNPDGIDEAWIATLDESCGGDFNKDGLLNIFDFLAFQTAFGNGC